MDNKGFTLVELLLTIAILGLIVGIAVPSYTGITKAIKNNQRNNIIEKIEIAASKYAFDTEETIIFVDKLVTEGYIESDQEDGSLEDPVNNGRLNCYIVEMEKESNYYKAKFKDDKNYENDGVCDLSKLSESSANVSILVNGSEYTSTNSWLKGNITLKAYSKNTLVIDCTNNRCVWTSSSGASTTGTDTIVLNNVSSILDTKYTFQYTIYDDNSNNVKRYTNSVSLKIDNASPIIYDNQMVITNRYVYTTSKTIKVVASDGKGSGIEGYYLGKNTVNCNSTSNNYQTSNYFTVSENGTYTICVKDKIGNVSSSSVNINYIS